jgi:hypothetical protein
MKENNIKAALIYKLIILNIINISYKSYYEYVVKNKLWKYLIYGSNVIKTNKTSCLGFVNLNPVLHRVIEIEVRVVFRFPRTTDVC